MIRKRSNLVEGSLLAIIDSLLGAKSIIVYFMARVVMTFRKKTQL